LESMYIIWGKHWFWRRFVNVEVGKNNLPWSYDHLIYVKLFEGNQNMIIVSSARYY
jgi:hypothetical protein